MKLTRAELEEIKFNGLTIGHSVDQEIYWDFNKLIEHVEDTIAEAEAATVGLFLAELNHPK